MGGVCVALSVVSVMISSMIPGLELTFYGVSSIFTAVMIIESGLAGGALTYVASSLLCIMIVPNKIAVIPFIFFFGLYGFIKYFAERYRNPVGQIAVKVICFALIFGIAWFFFKALFFGNIVLLSGRPTLSSFSALSSVSPCIGSAASTTPTGDHSGLVSASRLFCHFWPSP